MAEVDRTNPATPTIGQAAAGPELRIEICRDEWAEFEGTADQLIAEGLIPEGFEWPQAAAYKRWEAGGFKCWLNRKRPEGHRGLMRSWLELDNWCIRVSVTGRDHAWRRRRALDRKAEELRVEFYHLTDRGSRERAAEWRRYCEAGRDKTFQAFKSRIPGLMPPKRGRKPKAATQGEQK